MNHKTACLFLLVVPAILVCAVGCATAPVVTEVPGQIQPGLAELRGLLLQGKADVQAVSNAALQLTQQSGDVSESNVSRLDEAVNKLEATRVRSWAVHEDVQAKAKAHFADWEKQLKTMSPQVAEEGAKRREASMASFELLRAKSKELAAVYDPYAGKLLEALRYLKSDRTPAGLKIVAPPIKEQMAKEGDLTNKLNGLVAQIDAMKGGK